MSKKSPAKKTARKASDKPQSASIAKSWTNKAVAEARATKNKVKVNGTEYRSVLDAFEQLKLPVGQHITFRMALKETGRKVFETEKGVKHTFTIVK